MCTDAPDTSKQQEAALMTAQLSKEQLDFVKQIYAEGAGDRAFTSDTAREVAGLQLEAMRGQIGLADEFRADRAPFRAVEQRIVDDALAFNTEDKREELAGAARSDVAQAFDGQRGQMTRALARTGANPVSGRGIGLQRQLASDEALATASAGRDARMKATTLGSALLADAAQLGKGNMSGQATTTGIALNAGSGAVQSSNVPNVVTAGGVGMMGDAYAGARQGMAQSANIYNSIIGLEQGAQQSNNSTLGALGSAAGTAATMFFA